MQKGSLVVIFLVVFIDLVGFGIIIPLGPYLGTSLGATPFQIGLLMSIYSIMQFLFSPFWGRLSDRIGRRPVILISLLGAAFAHLLYAFSNSIELLFVSRGLAGFFGANISAAMAYIADVTDEKDRSKGMGLIGAAFGLGFILGPTLGGVLGEIGTSISNQPPFGLGFSALGAAAICFLNFLFAIKNLKESLTEEVRGKLPKREKRLVLIKKFIVKPVLGSILVVLFLAAFSTAHMEATLGLFVKDLFGWSLKQASFAFAYVGILHVVTQGFLIRKLMPKLGEARMMVIGGSMTCLGLFGIGLSHSILFLGIAVTFLGLGNGFFNPALMGSVSLNADPQDQGAVMGIAQSFSALGRIVGPASGGFVYGLGHSNPFFLASLIIACGIGVIISQYKKLPHSGQTIVDH